MEGRFVNLEESATPISSASTQKLSQAVFDHQKLIEALQRELVALQRRMHDLGNPVADEKPPHYLSGGLAARSL